MEPRTAATFQVLEFFHMITLVSKISAFDFYTTLGRRADNTGTKDIPFRYPAFLLMIRQWRHLKLLKRMGRGYDKGERSTGEGESAVLCPACPHPGKNLPTDWKDAPPNRQWLYTLFLGIDANFRLKRLNVSKAADDPDLNQGCAYFVNDESFQHHLRKFDSKVPNDTSSCSNYDAIKLASMRGAKGTAATGVGTVECIRHDMKRPVSVGDLQKGERYVNMDFFFFSSIRQNPPSKIVVSYDIACQWSKHLLERAGLYGVTDTFNSQSITFAVPKAHLPVHQDACKSRYSFNLLPRVGRTDGEAPERGWAATNAIANSTKEMGPGSRRDTLDDHFSDYNWRKVTKLATTLINKYTEAFKAQLEHATAFEEFSSALPQVNVSAWLSMVQEWESNSSKPNPYELKEKRISEAQVRLQLATQDTVDVDDSRHVHHFEITASMLIAQGLDLEEQQRRLRHESNNIGPHVSTIKRAKLAKRVLRLQRQIEAWQEFQHLYMPEVAMLRARYDKEAGGTPIIVMEMELMMPSQILQQINCNERLIEHEWQLRYAQATDTIHELQRMLLIRRQLFKSKERYGTGQRHHTRSVGMIKNVQDKVQRAVKKYRSTREHLTALATHLRKEGWESMLRPLTDKDIRAPDEEETLSEGHRSFSWIWRTGSISNSDSAAQEVLRIEWCKARARVHRWQEECVLVKEEMRRVLQFFDWEVSRWKNHAAAEFETEGPDLIEGLRGYAHRQANIRSAMRARCSSKWKSIQEGTLTLAGQYIDGETGFIDYQM